jgi:hypothetical protein
VAARSSTTYADFVKLTLTRLAPTIARDIEDRAFTFGSMRFMTSPSIPEGMVAFTNRHGIAGIIRGLDMAEGEDRRTASEIAAAAARDDSIDALRLATMNERIDRVQEQAMLRGEEAARRRDTVALECQEAVDALKIVYGDEVTPEMELRMIALGQQHLPGPGQTPRQYMEQLFSLARAAQTGVVRPPDRNSFEAYSSTMANWNPPYRYEPREPGFWNDALRQQDERNDMREQQREQRPWDRWRRAITGEPAPPPPRDAGMDEIARMIRGAGGGSAIVPARTEATAPKPVEVRVSPPTGKRRIDLDEE